MYIYNSIINENKSNITSKYASDDYTKYKISRKLPLTLNHSRQHHNLNYKLNGINQLKTNIINHHLLITKLKCENQDLTPDTTTTTANTTDINTTDTNIREDDVLPNDLSDALMQSSLATARAFNNGNSLCIVEILLPEFWDPISGALFKEEGDQMRFWKLNYRFIENLALQFQTSNITAIFPDMGVAAMLANIWKDSKFNITCLSDRKIKLKDNEEDEIIVIASPDPGGLDYCRNIVENMSETSSLVMFNPRLASGDVGIGLNIRRMRKTFLDKFTITYSLRPIGDIGSIFKNYPNQWQVFIEDKNNPGRYNLISEDPTRPDGELLNDIIKMGLDEKSEEGKLEEKNVLNNIWSSVKSFQSFLNSLSK